jgi:hypothetical protein
MGAPAPAGEPVKPAEAPKAMPKTGGAFNGINTTVVSVEQPF